MNQELGVPLRLIIYGGMPSLRLAEFQLRRFSAWFDLLDKTDFRSFASNLMVQMFAPDFVASHPDQFDAMVEDFCRYYEPRPEAVRALILAMRDAFANPLTAKERYACPVCVIGAEADLLLPMVYINEYAREIGAVEAIILKGGHSPRIEQHERLAEAILDIAARHQP